MTLGYHALPSFAPLHLHIISSDMDSPRITKREHVVTFLSSFFVEPDSLERHLDSAFAEGLAVRVRRERAAELRASSAMTCVRCARAAASLPDWKRHNRTCNAAPLALGTGGRLNSLLGWQRKIVSEEVGER
jgi:aprataxin